MITMAALVQFGFTLTELRAMTEAELEAWVRATNAHNERVRREMDK